MVAKKCEKNGKKIRWERFPKIAIFRCFQKMGLADVSHSTYANIIENKMNGDLENFYQVVGKTKIKEMVADKKEADMLEEFLLEGVETFEFEIFRVSSRIATLIELMDSESRFVRSEYTRKYTDITLCIKEMESKVPEVKDMSDMNSIEFNMIRKIASLRNQNRWATRSYRVDCSVLGHLFDTAIFAYLIALNNEMSEKEAAKMFFMGIWHDVAEAWTKDIPSPTKDAYHGFREASEEFELECLKKYIYDVVDEHLRKSIKEIMMEEQDAKAYKKLLKSADYLSADSECWRQLVAGSRDNYFKRVLCNDLEKADPAYIKGAFKELLEFYCKVTEPLITLG